MCRGRAHSQSRLRIYVVVVRDTSHLEPAAAFSLTAFDDSAGDQHYHEMDIENSKWGDV